MTCSDVTCVWQRRPTSHTAISISILIEHASTVVSMLNQMTDGRSIMQKRCCSVESLPRMLLLHLAVLASYLGSPTLQLPW